jgi:myo-inositol-1(or 4)-monophosphatase
VSVALVSAGRPLIGLLDAPARGGGEFWSARPGRAPWRNGERLGGQHPHLAPGARVPADSLRKEDRDLTMVDKPNSIALRIAMVAADEADLWRPCAGASNGTSAPPR